MVKKDTLIDKNKRTPKVRVAWATKRISQMKKNEIPEPVAYVPPVKPVPPAFTENAGSDVKDQIQEFSESTTFHGLKNAFGKDKTIKERFFWCVLILGCLTIVCIDVTTRIRYYVSAPSSVNLDSKYVNSVEFPAITICNQNAFRRTLAVQNNHVCTLETLYGSNQSCHADESVSDVTLDHLYTVNAHKAEDLVHGCKFRGKPCGAQNFTSIVTDFGLCYTFNGWNTTSHTIYAPGLHNGLELIINAEHYDYMVGPRSSAGIKIQVHDKTHYPMPEEYGYELPTGKHTFMHMKILQEHKLPPPHGECHVTNPVVFEKYSYSTAACNLECKNRYIIEQCGCRYMFVPNTPGMPRICSTSDFNCMEHASEHFVITAFSFCNCHLPCEFIRYKGYLSFGSLSSFAQQDLQENEAVKTGLLEALDVSFRYDSQHQIISLVYQNLTTMLTNDSSLASLNSLILKFDHLLWDFNKALYYTKTFYNSNSTDEKKREHAEYMVSQYNVSVDQALYQVKNLSNQLSAISSGGDPPPLSIYTDSIQSLTVLLRDIQQYLDIIDEKWIIECELGLELRQNDIDSFFEFGNSDACQTVKNGISSNESTFQFFLEQTDAILQNGNWTHSDIDAMETNLVQVENILTDKQNEQNHILINNATNTIGLYYYMLRYVVDRIELFQILIQNECTHEDYLQYFTNAQAYTQSLFNTLDLYFLNGTSFYSVSEYVNTERNEDVKKIEDDRDELLKKNFKCIDFVSLSLNLIISISNCSLIHENAHAIQQAGDTLLELPNFTENLTNNEALRTIGDTVAAFSRVHLIAADFRSSNTIDTEFVRDNFLYVNIFFNELSIQELKQREVYDIFALLGSIGGALGLFIGASVVSICEIGEMVLKVVNKCILMRCKRRVGDLETEKSKV